MRYWNMARQRYCCGLARCWRALRLSADRAENAARKRALFGALIEESGSHMTRRWRGESRAHSSLEIRFRASFCHFIPAFIARERAHARERRGTGALAAPLGTEHWSEHRLL